MKKRKLKEVLKELLSELEYAEYNVTETRISALERIYKELDKILKDKEDKE